jgi:WD40 repeat protein
MCELHSDSARSVVFSPDGSKLASASNDKTQDHTDVEWNGSTIYLLMVYSFLISTTTLDKGHLHKEEPDEEAQAGRLEVREDGEVQEL